MTILVKTIEPSTRKGKRFQAVLTNGDRVHFGQENGETFIDGASEEKRLAYHARHYGNKREKQLIDTLTISPALMSMYLLWSYTADINKNLKYLNDELQKKELKD
jgi:hypothetical protein